MMNRSTLLNVFIRSLTVQASFNFWRMQNLGFAFAMLPLIRRRHADRTRIAASLGSHLQIFNTHPYMVAPVIGTVARIEEGGDDAEAAELKKTLMGPYAAIGDSFFWGALRTLAAVGAVIFAFSGTLSAPLVFLLLYCPFHGWVRGKGFIEGYRRGKSGIEFIRSLDLPSAAARIRVLSLILIGILAAQAVGSASGSVVFLPEAIEMAAAVVLLILFSLGIRKGITPVQILYGTALLCMVISF